MTDNALTTRQGALFVQPDGPNTPAYFLGCHDLGDIAQPLGEPTILRCMNPKGGWRTVGQTIAPPENITTSIENMTFLASDWLDKLKNCPFNLLVLQRSGGDADLISNWARAKILFNCLVTNITESALVHHEEEQASTISRDITAWPPLIRMNLLSGKLRSMPAAEGYFPQDVDNAAVFFSNQLNCNTREAPGKYGWIASKAPGGAAASVLISDDYGATWIATGADPFANDKDIADLVAFTTDGINFRILAAQVAAGGAQGLVAYSDDNGESWTTVNIGGATDGHGAHGANSLFVLDAQHIYLASDLGYVYFSEDGGETWSALESGVLAVSDYLAVFFDDENDGMVVGDADVILFTSDGGTSWAQYALGTADNINCVWKSGDIWWVGTDAGEIYYSLDDGATWAKRGGWIGSGTGSIAQIAFSNEMIGYMTIENGAGSKLMQTITGGMYWSEIAIPPTAGITDLSVADTNFLFLVGPIQDVTGWAVKVDDE